MVARKKDVPIQGNVYKASLDPVRGHEQRGYRPILVVSPEKYNRRAKFAIICPITSRAKGYPFEVPCENNDVQGVILVDQVRALDWSVRTFEYMGTLSDAVCEEVRQKLIMLISRTP